MIKKLFIFILITLVAAEFDCDATDEVYENCREGCVKNVSSQKWENACRLKGTDMKSFLTFKSQVSCIGNCMLNCY